MADLQHRDTIDNELLVQPSFDFLLEEDAKQDALVAEHKAWLKTIRKERPSPHISYNVAVYIRYFNQTRYENYLEYLKQNFLSTISQYPKWNFVGFYIDHGSTAPNMESAKAWSELLTDCGDGKVDLIITQKVSSVSRKLNEVIFCSRLLAAQENPVGIYFVSEDLFTLSSYYMEDLTDPSFFPDPEWKMLPDDEQIRGVLHD